MYGNDHHLILPSLQAALPCTPRPEFICIAGGRPPALSWLSALAQQNGEDGTKRSVWAIDRGVDVCRTASLPPSYLIGDGDSADHAAWAWAKAQGAQIHRYPPEKDATDTELALDMAVHLSPPPLVILTGAFGGRLDHLASTAAVAAHTPLPCVLADEHETLFYLKDGASIRIICTHPPYAVSLLPFTETCTGVTTAGLHWELQAAQLSSRSARTVSNVLARENTARTFTVSIEQGVLGIYLCHKD